MFAVVVSCVLLGVTAVVLFFTGWLTIGIKALFYLSDKYHQKLRLDRRPARIFLIRHGESQANVDPTLCSRLPDFQVELTERGRQQALDAGKKLKSMIGNQSILGEEVEEQKNFGHFYYRFSCGESGADVHDRASLFLDTLFREMDTGHHDPTQNIVIVSHGLFMRLFLMRYFRWDVEELESFKQFYNCEICELRKVNGVYTLDGQAVPPTQWS